MPATAQHANAAAMNWPSCWRAGVAPTSWPVFRSCEMSPALDAATQTTVPTVRIAARAAMSVQPRATNTTDTPSSVTSAMPEVGFDDTPMRPTMRDETTTKARPKMATPSAATQPRPGAHVPAQQPGHREQRQHHQRPAPTTTTQPGMSRSVRGDRAAVRRDVAAAQAAEHGARATGTSWAGRGSR